MPSKRAATENRRVGEDRQGGEPGTPVNSESLEGHAEPINRSEHFATQLREMAPALFMYSTLGYTLRDVDTMAYKLYRDRLLQDCGAPKDPIEVMLIEQLALAHLNSGLLHGKASGSSSVECASVYMSAAARLMAEFRRSALALQAYRAASRQLAAVNLEPAVIVSGELVGPEDDAEKNHKHAEMGSRPKDNDEEPPIIRIPRAATR
jgi:hypothetical protein